jgi:hypothetical protein
MLKFTRKDTDEALAGVRVAWLIRDFYVLGLRADDRPRRGITELLQEKEHLDRLAAVVRQWIDALGTPVLREAWLAVGATFNNTCGLGGFEAFRSTTNQIAQVLARSSAMLATEISWERNLDDDLTTSARARFIRDSVAPCFKEICDHSMRGETKGIWRTANAPSSQPTSKPTAEGPFISFAIEIFRVAGSETTPDTIDHALRRDRQKKGRVRDEPTRGPSTDTADTRKSRKLKPSTLLSKLAALLAAPVIKDAWYDWHTIFGPSSLLGEMDAYMATLDLLAQHKNLQHVPRKKESAPCCRG